MYIKLVAAPWCGLAVLTGIAAAQPPLPYDSAYADYRAYREEPVASWPESNREAARVGGHAGVFGGSMHSSHSTAKPAAGAPAGKPAGMTTPAAPHREHH